MWEKVKIRNFEKVLNQIKGNPAQWDQGVWHCGTQHCFAGWAQVKKLGIQAIDTATVMEDAKQYLGLRQKEANYLFNAERTMGDFEGVLAKAKAHVEKERKHVRHLAARREAYRQRKAENQVVTRHFKHMEEEEQLIATR